MDDQIRADIIAELRAIDRARVEVETYTGRTLTIACDSAEQVYMAGLKALGHPTKDLHPAAARRWSLVRNRPKKLGLMAQDAAATKKFGDRFPGAGKLKIR